MVQNPAYISQRWPDVFSRHIHGEFNEHAHLLCNHFSLLLLTRLMTLGKLAVNDLKAIGASFSQLITATMISRLVLNLRSSPSGLPPGEHAGQTLIAPIKFMERTIGNLGEELETEGFDHNSSSTGTDDEIPLRDFGKSRNVRHV
jgi:hypothetical protein